MTDSNRVRVAAIREATLGTTPASPRFRTVRDTGEGLEWNPEFFSSNERRSDRMRPDGAKINEMVGGTLSWEQYYPAPFSAQSLFMESALCASWTSTPERDNDGTADSVITDVATTGGGTVTVTTGAAFVIGHLVQQTGFTAAANNTVARVTTGGATSYVCSGGSFATEAAPPATARVKVVGVEGASGDIVATSTGLTSTTMNFVNMGIVVGMWLKLGGTAAGTQFSGTAANNGWARVAAVTANAITLDNRPTGWAGDTASGKTIRIFFGDILRNGTTLLGQTVERTFLGQTTPTYIRQAGMVVDQLSTDIVTEAGITGQFTFMGMSGSQSTSLLSSATYAAAPTGTVMTANVSVGEIRIGGSAASSPNWVRRVSTQLANNLRRKTAVGTVGAVDIGVGSCDVTGTVETYFGSNSLLATAMADTVSSLSHRVGSGGQWLVETKPRVKFTSSTANAGGPDQDVVLSLDYEASLDTLTNCHIQYDRLEWVE